MNRKSHYGAGISVYPIKVLQIQQDSWPSELVVVACRKNDCLEKEVFGLARVLRSMGITCRTDFDVEVCLLYSHEMSCSHILFLRYYLFVLNFIC